MKCPKCGSKQIVYAEIPKKYFNQYVKGEPIPFTDEKQPMIPINKCDDCKHFIIIKED